MMYTLDGQAMSTQASVECNFIYILTQAEMKEGKTECR